MYDGEFAMFVIDPRTRAPAAIIGMDDLSPEVFQAIMARPLVIDGADFVSWGRVTRAQIDSMIEADCLLLEDELTHFPPEQAIWSLCYEAMNVR